MIINPELHHRHSIRLKDYDYSSDGYYFVTICVKDRLCLLGDIINGNNVSNEFGDIVKSCWLDLTNNYSNINLDEYIIMPNHFHGIIIIENRRGLIHQTHIKEYISDNKGLINLATTKLNIENADTGKYLKHPLGKIIRTFKAKSSKLIHDSTGHDFQWQRNYYDHIIRDEEELNRTREYVINNPLKWEIDEYNKS